VALSEAGSFSFASPRRKPEPGFACAPEHPLFSLQGSAPAFGQGKAPWDAAGTSASVCLAPGLSFRAEAPHRESRFLQEATAATLTTAECVDRVEKSSRATRSPGRRSPPARQSRGRREPRRQQPTRPAVPSGRESVGWRNGEFAAKRPQGTVSGSARVSRKGELTAGR